MKVVRGRIGRVCNQLFIIFLRKNQEEREREKKKKQSNQNISGWILSRNSPIFHLHASNNP